MNSATTARSIVWAAMLSVVIGSGAQTDDALAVGEPKGWERILVPADPLMVESVPSPGQLIYQTSQYGAFLHYGPAVFLNGDFFSVPDPKVFNPTQLDAEQWVRVAKSFGAKHLIFSAKHHNGFCLWLTETTDYGVRSSPWKNGRGDLVRDVADACRKHGIALGICYSQADRHFPCCASVPFSKEADTLSNRDRYWPVCRRQIEELLTNYGDLVCLWLDGCGNPFDGQALNPKTDKPYMEELFALAKAKQPTMVSGMLLESHYCGGEDGTAPYPLWNVLGKGEGAKLWGMAPWAEGWILPESINCHGTFAWIPVKPEKLIEEYYGSVGRGANFLQALVPDQRGLIDDAEAECVAQFGAELQRRFGRPIAQTDSSKSRLAPGVLEVDLRGAKKIAHVVLEEEIAKGQHVLKYAVDAAVNGTWKTVAEGESIGRKRIERFQPAITGEKVRLRIVRANAIPSISALTVYNE